MVIKKTLALKGKKSLAAIFAKFSEVPGLQSTSRPQAVLAFTRFVSGLYGKEEEAEQKLAKAAKQPIDESGIQDEDVPGFYKIIVNVEENDWEQAMAVFRRVFSLQRDPQMPYFLKVAGTAYLNDLEEQDRALVETQGPSAEEITESAAFQEAVERFRALSTIDEKLEAIYKMQLENRLRCSVPF